MTNPPSDNSPSGNPSSQPDWQRWEAEHGFPRAGSDYADSGRADFGDGSVRPGDPGQPGPGFGPNLTKPTAERPAPVDVETARHLWWGVALIGLINAFLTLTTVFGSRGEFAQTLVDDVRAQNSEMELTIDSAQSYLTAALVVTMVIIVGFGALFVYWVSKMRAGKMWARMLLTMIGSLTVFLAIPDLFGLVSADGALPVVMTVLGIGQGVLAAGAIVLMHRRESNEYFARSRPV